MGNLPWPGVPTLAGGTYLGWGNLPWSGVPTLAGGTYLGRGLPILAGGGAGVPTLAGMGYPLRCEQTENITFPHPSDAFGKNIVILKRLL